MKNPKLVRPHYRNRVYNRQLTHQIPYRRLHVCDLVQVKPVYHEVVHLNFQHNQNIHPIAKIIHINYELNLNIQTNKYIHKTTTRTFIKLLLDKFNCKYLNRFNEIVDYVEK